MTARKLHLLHICGAKAAGGAETFFLRFIDAIKDHARVTCIVRQESWLAGQLADRPINTHLLPFGGMFDFKTKAGIKELVNELQPHVVQVWMNRAGKFLPPLTVPTVGRLGGPYNLKYYKNCDYLVGNTLALKNYIIEAGWSPQRAGCLPNFAPKPLPAPPSARVETRARYKIPSKACVLFMSTRIHQRKGVDLAIEALARLPKSTHLLLAGEGPAAGSLKSLAKELGVADRVHFAGWVTHLAPLAMAADIWLVPSRSEPLGNTVLDAWWHKKPVIATDTGGPAQLITAGETGLLVPVDDLLELTHAIIKIMKDPDLAKKLAQQALQEVKAKYSVDVMMPRYLEFYEKISKAN